SGYTIYYMGINTGAGLAPLVGLLIAQNPDFREFLQNHGLDPNLCWKLGFAVPAIGMTIGLIQFLLGAHRLGDAGIHPIVPSDPKRAARDRTVLIGLVIGVVALVVFGMLIDKFVFALSGNILVNVFG